jgi:hypothetical protein
MGRWADKAAQEFGEQEAAPVSTVRDTTVSTTPAQYAKESRDIEKDKLHKAAFVTPIADSVGFGAARGATLGMVDRLVGEGAQIGDDVYNMVSGKPITPTREAEAEERGKYLAGEAKARADAPVSYVGGELVSGMIPALATGGASRIAAPASATTSGLGISRNMAVKAMSDTRAVVPAQNFVAGAMNQPSNDLKDLTQAGLGGVVVGSALGKAAETTIGKVIKGSKDLEARGLVRDILRNEETDIAASATVRKRFYERANSAVQEVRKDKNLEGAIREGDATAARNIAKSTLQVISEPRAGLYKELDSLGMLGIDQIDAAIRKAEKTATGANKSALESMRGQLEKDWIPKWKEEGKLVTVPGRPLAVRGEGVRSWLSDAQNQASTVIGGLEEGSRKKVKDALEDVAHDVWHGHLAKIEKQSPELVNNIREYDRRASGLMALESVMKQRQGKDYEGLMGFAKKAERVALPMMTAGAVYSAAAGHPAEAALGIGSYLLARKAPSAARYINDNVVAPIARAAENGVPWAQVLTQAAQSSVPESVARAAYDQGARKVREMMDKKRSGGSDYSTSTGVR